MDSRTGARVARTTEPLAYSTEWNAGATGATIAIDGETLFQEDDRDACTVDGCHPNDLGFYRMYQTVRPVMKQALGLALEYND